MARTKVFISYAHKDDHWRKRVVAQLGVLARQGLLELWDDRKIKAGDLWFEQIHQNMLEAKLAVLLISASFLTSEFILEQEIPKLFNLHEKDAMHIYPLLISPCPWQEVAWLARMQIRPLEAKALSTYQSSKAEEALAKVASEIAIFFKPIVHISD